jgi:hypothetical protein
MIREATINDLEILYLMSVEFLKESKINESIPFNENDLKIWILNLIHSTNSTVLVYDEDGIKGSIAGGITPHYTNKNFKIANEFAWWVLPAFRGKVGKPLFNAFEIWAKTNDANMIVMCSMEDLGSKVLDRVYKSKGYTLMENSYRKVI